MEGQSQTTAPPERGNFTGPRQQRVATPTGQEANQPVVDARSLGARPEGARGPLLVRKFYREFPSLDGSPDGAGRRPPIRRIARHLDERSIVLSRDEDVNDSPLDSSKGTNTFQQVPPSERSISQSRGPPIKNRDQSYLNKDVNKFQPDSSRERNGFQRLSSGEQSARRTGAREAVPASQAHKSRFPNDQSSFQRKGDARLVQSRRSRTGRPRSDRNRDDAEPRRRNRDAKRGIGENNRRGPQEEPMTGEERQYLKEKSEQESPKDITFEPMEFSRETFSGMGSATASDEWGMSELLGEKLLLARKYLDREFIQWDNKEQKADVMAVAKKLRAVSAEGKSDNQAKKASPTSGDGDEQAQALMQKLFAGEYAEFEKLVTNDVLGHVERNVHRNETFYPDDEKSLLAKVKSIMPAKRAPIGARNDVRV